MLTRAEKKVANQAAFAALRARYDALSTETRDKVKAEFALQRAKSPELRWAQFLTVVLPMVQEMPSAS